MVRGERRSEEGKAKRIQKREDRRRALQERSGLGREGAAEGRGNREDGQRTCIPGKPHPKMDKKDRRRARIVIEEY